jgi:hypothetical protein
MISNTTQDLELIQLETRMSAAEGSITTLGAGLLLTSGGLILALDLVNQKSWILFFQKPLRCDISNNIYLDFDTNYFSIDASDNLTLNNDFWRKDISNNTYFVSGKVGIGLTNPASNYILDVSGNINCNEIYRNGTSFSSTLSLFLPLTGGSLSGPLSGTTISATYMTANTFTGSGAELTNLNVSNSTTGTLSVSRGGTGTDYLNANQILIGNGSLSFSQSANLTWNNATNTLSATNFIGSGSGLTNLNASNITSGTLTVNGSGLAALNASNVTSGTLTVSRGGIGTTSLTSNHILLGNGTNPINQSSNLLFDTTNNRLGICKSQPNYTLDVSGNINANNINLQNLSNPNNTTISINSETTSYNSKLILGSGYIGTNPANSFTDISTCQIITKRNNLYIDAAVGKTININSEANGDIISYGTWAHNGDLSANSFLATAFIENNVSLTNKYVKKYGFSFLTATPIAIVNTPYFKYDINLNNYTTTINFDDTVPTRKFRIMTWLKSGYHEVSPTNNLDYEIIMSNPPGNGIQAGLAGLNIQAYSLSDSKNYRLDKTSSTGQFILRNSFNYLSYVSTVQTNIACLIIDYF